MEDGLQRLGPAERRGRLAWRRMAERCARMAGPAFGPASIASRVAIRAAANGATSRHDAAAGAGSGG